MQNLSTVSIVAVDRFLIRPDFEDDRFHLVTFELVTEGLPSSTFKVWVHQSQPDADVPRVAFACLARSLANLAELASDAAESYSKSEVDIPQQRTDRQLFPEYG